MLLLLITILLFSWKCVHVKCRCHCFWQDAHEFLNFLLNEIVDTLEKEAQAAKNDQEASSPAEKTANGPKNAHANGGPKEQLDTWVHKNFQVLSAGFIYLLITLTSMRMI